MAPARTVRPLINARGGSPWNTPLIRADSTNAMNAGSALVSATTCPWLGSVAFVTGEGRASVTASGDAGTEADSTGRISVSKLCSVARAVVSCARANDRATGETGLSTKAGGGVSTGGGGTAGRAAKVAGAGGGGGSAIDPLINRIARTAPPPITTKAKSRTRKTPNLNAGFSSGRFGVEGGTRLSGPLP